MVSELQEFQSRAGLEYGFSIRFGKKKKKRNLILFDMIN